MSDLVPAEDIERIVGARRHPTKHLARAVSAEETSVRVGAAQGTVYLLHSQECKESGLDLRECPFSLALDEGIDVWHWRAEGAEGRTVEVEIVDGFLWPVIRRRAGRVR